jgi:hypothetical protein
VSAPEYHHSHRLARLAGRGQFHRGGGRIFEALRVDAQRFGRVLDDDVAPRKAVAGDVLELGDQILPLLDATGGVAAGGQPAQAEDGQAALEDEGVTGPGDRAELASSSAGLVDCGA